MLLRKVFLAFIFAGFLTSCSDDNNEAKQFKAEFLEDCTKRTGSSSYCKCTYSKLLEMYTYQQLIMINNSNAYPVHKEFAESAQKVADQCNK